MLTPNNSGQSPMMTPGQASQLTSYLYGLRTPEAVQQFAAQHQNDINVVGLASSVANAMKKAMVPQMPPPQGTVTQQAVQQMAPQAPQQMPPQQMAPQQMPQQLPETSGIGQLNPGQGVQNMAGGGITGEPHVPRFSGEATDGSLVNEPQTPYLESIGNAFSVFPKAWNLIPNTLGQVVQAIPSTLGKVINPTTLGQAVRYVTNSGSVDPTAFATPNQLAAIAKPAQVAPAVVASSAGPASPAGANADGSASFNLPSPLFGGVRKAVAPGLPALQGQGGGYQPLTEAALTEAMRVAANEANTPSALYDVANGLSREKDAATNAQYKDIKDMSKKDRANLDERSDNALAMALMKAGFTMMGTPGGLSTAVSKGGIEGLQQYGQDKTYVDQARRELNKSDRETQAAQDAALRGNNLEAQTYMSMSDTSKQNAMLNRLAGLGFIEKGKVDRMQIALHGETNAIQRAELPAKLELLAQQARQAGANADYLGVTKIDAQQRAQIENLVTQDMKAWYAIPANYGKTSAEADAAADNFRMRRAAALGITPGTAAPSIDPRFIFHTVK